MAGKALGLIETRGLVGAIEALDASLKAAQVHLAGMDMVSGGLVTIRITGDTGAVKAAVSAGDCAARRVGVVVASHVIPRPHAEVEGIAYGPGVGGRRGEPAGPAGGAGAEPERTAPGDSELEESEVNEEEAPRPAEPREIEATVRLKELLKGTDVDELLEDITALSELPVWKLRRIARHVAGIGMAGVEISNARKEQLLNEMIRVALTGGDKADAD